MQVLLDGGNRHDPLVSVLQMSARFVRFHGLGLHHNDACDNLQAIGDSVLQLLQQHFLLSQKLVLFAL